MKKQKSVDFIFILFFVSLISLNLHATDESSSVMVMVNLNYSKEEVQAASDIARERGQKLYIIPASDPKKSNYAEKAGDIRSRVISFLNAKLPKMSEHDKSSFVWGMGKGEENLEKLPTDNKLSKADFEQLKKMNLQYAEYFQKLVDSEMEMPSIKIQLSKLSKVLSENNEKVSTLIVSGHSGVDGFSGESSLNISMDAFQELSRASPNLFQDARHVLLMGCYSNTEISNQIWRNKGLFNNASLIGGFGGRAPLRTQPVSAKYIRETLRTADKLDRMSLKNIKLSPKMIKSAFQSLKSVQLTFSAIDYCGQYMNRASDNSLSCSVKWGELDARFETINNKYIGDLKFRPTDDPPLNVANSELRNFYNFIQGMCANPNPGSAQLGSDEDRQMYLEATIKAIFWWKIQIPFADSNKENISKLDELLKKNKINIQLPVLDGKMGRKNFLEQISQIEKKIYEFRNKESSKDACAAISNDDVCEDEKLISALSDAYKSLESLDDGISLNWL